jgi:hypothetical protein
MRHEPDPHQRALFLLAAAATFFELYAASLREQIKKIEKDSVNHE